MAEETANADLGKIEILVSEKDVSYNTNMTVPDMLFWLRVVADLAVNKVLSTDE